MGLTSEEADDIARDLERFLDGAEVGLLDAEVSIIESIITELREA